MQASFTQNISVLSKIFTSKSLSCIALTPLAKGVLIDPNNPTPRSLLPFTARCFAQKTYIRSRDFVHLFINDYYSKCSPYRARIMLINKKQIASNIAIEFRTAKPNT